MANTFIFDDEEEEPQPTMESPQDELPDEGGDEDDESGEGSNRTFLIIAAVLGVIVLLSLVCMAVFTFAYFIPNQNARTTQEAIALADASQTAVFVEQTAIAQAFTPTPLPTETPTLEPTATPVLLFPTDTPVPVDTVDPATATVQALLDSVNQTATAQAAAGTSTPGTAVAGAGTASPTALSQTGFADEVGLPGLFIAAVILVAVILLARRLRQTPLAR
jgi:cytoskeletal protein RodZ